MKIAIVSDIHGNYFAYKKAKEVMMNLNVDHIFFLGDVFGYYYDGLEIFRDLLHTENVTMILGNHDLIFIDAFKNKNQSEISHYIEKYGSSVNDFLRDVTEDEIVLLESIPSKKEFTLDGIRFTLIHGVLRTPSIRGFTQIHPLTQIGLQTQTFFFWVIRIIVWSRK
jgi:predicted phosphodiesterase